MSSAGVADRIQMADFNSMTGAIEDALTGHNGRMDGQDAAIAAQAARMDRLGNCQIYHGTYTGNSSASSKTLSFPHKPIFVMVLNNSAGFLLSVQGLDRARLSLGGTNYTTLCTWSGNFFHGTRVCTSILLKAEGPIMWWRFWTLRSKKNPRAKWPGGSFLMI